MLCKKVVPKNFVKCIEKHLFKKILEHFFNKISVFKKTFQRKFFNVSFTHFPVQVFGEYL